MTDLTAAASGIHGEESHTVRVVWDRNATKRYGFFIDNDVMFLKGDVCCNRYPSDVILKRLEARAANPDASPFVSLVSHEQYSFPFYRDYIPEHFERLEAAVCWCTEHGYAPGSHHDAFPAEAE